MLAGEVQQKDTGEHGEQSLTRESWYREYDADKDQCHAEEVFQDGTNSEEYAVTGILGHSCSRSAKVVGWQADEDRQGNSETYRQRNYEQQHREDRVLPRPRNLLNYLG